MFNKSENILKESETYRFGKIISISYDRDQKTAWQRANQTIETKINKVNSKFRFNIITEGHFNMEV